MLNKSEINKIISSFKKREDLEVIIKGSTSLYLNHVLNRYPNDIDIAILKKNEKVENNEIWKFLTNDFKKIGTNVNNQSLVSELFNYNGINFKFEWIKHSKISKDFTDKYMSVRILKPYFAIFQKFSQLYILLKKYCTNKDLVDVEKLYDTYNDISSLLFVEEIMDPLFNSINEIIQKCSLDYFISNFYMTNDFNLGFVSEWDWFIKNIIIYFKPRRLILDKINSIYLNINLKNIIINKFLTFMIKNKVVIYKDIKKILISSNKKTKETIMKNLSFKSSESDINKLFYYFFTEIFTDQVFSKSIKIKNTYINKYPEVKNSVLLFPVTKLKDGDLSFELNTVIHAIYTIIEYNY